MPVKSVLDIEVNDAAFKQFSALFGKYQDALKKLPDAWKAHETAVDDSKSSFVALGAAMMAQMKILHSTTLEQEKLRREVDKTDRSMLSLGRATKGVFDQIKAITGSILKWGLISSAATLLSGAGGLFGYDALARSAAGSRRSAMGIGVSAGQLQAANITYDRIGGASDLLSRIADIQGDVSQQYLLTTRLGLSQNDVANRNPAELLPQTLAALRARWLALPPNMRNTMAGPLGLTEFASTSQLRTLGNMSDAEFAAMNADFGKRQGSMGINDATGSAYQNFLSRLDTAGQRLENTLISGLVKLSGPIDHVVEAFTSLVGSGINSEGFKQGIETFASWIDRLGKTLATQEARDAVVNFMNALGNLGKAIDTVASWINGQASSGAAPRAGSFGAWWQKQFPGFGGAPEYPAYADRPHANMQLLREGSAPMAGGPRGMFSRLEAQYGLPAGILDATWAVESSRSADLRTSPKGAMGPFQFMPGTASEYGLHDPYDLQQSADAAGRYYRNLLSMFGGDVDKAAAAYNAGPGTVRSAALKAMALGHDWRQELPDETKEYLNRIHRNMIGPGSAATMAAPGGSNINITVTNATGGNLVNVGTQLGAMAQ